MSTKRKQFKPKAFKDTESINSTFGNFHEEQGQETKKIKGRIETKSGTKDGDVNSQPDYYSKLKVENSDIVCSFCNAKFNDVTTLQNHTLQEHQHQQRQVIKLENEGDLSSSNTESSQSDGGILSFVCQQCDASLQSFAEFGCHMRTHIISTDREQKCNLCNATFTDPVARTSHIVEHFMENSVRVLCKECPAVTFHNFQQIRQHHADTHLEILYRCAICHQIFSSQHRFQEHSMAHNEEVLRYHCTSCNIPFETRNLLSIHVQLIHDRPIVGLPVTSTQQNLPQVSFCKGQITVQPEIRQVKCMVCDIKFESEDELDFHRLVVHCKVPRSDRCADCQAQIRTVAHFKDHIREHMRDEQTVACVICRQALRNDAQIDTHANYHMYSGDSTSEANPRCGICHKFLPEESLHMHVVGHSSQGDCPYCKKFFPNLSSLLTHVDSIHSDVEPPFQCHKCQQAFHFKSQLQHHRCSVAAHESLQDPIQERISPLLSQQRSYQCAYCPKIFGSEIALQGHSHVHSTRAYRCELCTLSFSSAARLETHRKKHFAEKNFTCQICDLKFVNRHDLSQHVQMHGGNLVTHGRSASEPAVKTTF